MPAMANAGMLTTKRENWCWRKKAETNCTKEGARIFQGGIYVGADAIAENTGLDDAINSIQNNFPKSMFCEAWKWSDASGATKSNFVGLSQEGLLLLFFRLPEFPRQVSLLHQNTLEIPIKPPNTA